MKVLQDREVVIRKPHNCWGCTRLYPKDTSMQLITNVDPGIVHSYWCRHCMEFMETLEPWEKEDGFEFGGLLNYENYPGQSKEE